MRPDAVLETALYASDLDAAEGFYGGVLGLPRVAPVGERHVFFRLGGAMLLVFNPAATELDRRTTRRCRCRRMGRAGRGMSPSWRGGGARPGGGSGSRRRGWRSRRISFGRTAPARSMCATRAGNSVKLAEPRLWGFKS